MPSGVCGRQCLLRSGRDQTSAAWVAGDMYPQPTFSTEMSPSGCREGFRVAQRRPAGDECPGEKGRWGYISPTIKIKLPSQTVVPHAAAQYASDVCEAIGSEI